MGSLTKKTETRRQAKKVKEAKKKKRARAKQGTPKFPIHPEESAQAA